MSETVGLSQWLNDESLQELESWVNKYPESQKRSAVMRALMLLQESTGFLTCQQMDAVAIYLDMPAVAVYEVASFYSMYKMKATGRHVINVCTNISCKLRNVDAIVAALEEKTGVAMGETTEDGRFTLRSVECLGACVQAPMMEIDKTYHEHLTVEMLDAILEQYQ